MPTKHTPGPWVLKSWHEAQIVTRDGGDPIATVYADKNRKVIAAAPELFAALQKVTAALEYRDTDDYTRDVALTAAKAALAKVQA